MDTTIKWMAIYNDNSIITSDRYGFYDIDQHRLKEMRVIHSYKSKSKVLLSFRFIPEIMRLILFNRHRTNMGVNGKSIQSWLFIGYQMTINNTNYKCIWSVDHYTYEVRVEDSTRR